MLESIAVCGGRRRAPAPPRAPEGRHKPLRSYVIGCSIVLASCVHAGSGQGEGAPRTTEAGSSVGALPTATFTWRSGVDAGNGEMHAWLARGKVYNGRFAQVRAQLGTDTTGSYFIAWSYPQWAHHAWYGEPPQEVTGTNSDEAVALLESPDHSLLRCKFKLCRPDSGLAGGASGRCQLSEDMSTIRVELPMSAQN